MYINCICITYISYTCYVHQIYMYYVLLIYHIHAMCITSISIIYILCTFDSYVPRAQGSNNSYKPITNTTWVRARLCKLQKGRTRLASASDKVYQFAHGRWFFPGTPASSTTKIDRHDIAEILLKVALNTKNQKSNLVCTTCISCKFYVY
jgi:hypothetical protein